MIVDFRLTQLFLLTQWLYEATAIMCPDSSQWRLRTRARCNSTLPSYNCLYDESTATFVDFCTQKPDFQRPGYKFIIRGNIDGIECDKNRFQPIKFWTNGSNDCILEKTGCNEKGQVIHDEGSSTSDRTCRCDYTRGFAFVSSPKQGCYCNPSIDDCSCFMKPCSKFQVMTPDYRCITATDWTGIFKCPVITKPITIHPSVKKSTRCASPQSDLKKFSTMEMIVKKQPAIVVSVLTGICVIFVIVIWKRGNEMINCCRILRMMETDIEKQVDIRLNGNLRMMETDIEKKVEKRLNDQTMFKMKLKVNFNEIIHEIHGKEIVDKLTLTEAEKNTIQSCLGRIKGNKALLEILWNRGPLVYKEFITVLRKSNSVLADTIENTKDSDYQEDLEEELEKTNNKKIPDNVRKIHDFQIQEWVVNDKMIIETQASIAISKWLMESDCVFLVGRPGSGKSSILRHIALKLVKENESEDTDIIPAVVEPTHVIDYNNERRNQIFLLDDFCGKDKVNNQLIDLWKLRIEQILKIINQRDGFEHGEKRVKKTKTKIMISCNTSVYKSPIFEPLKKHLESFVFNLSTFPLTKEEREKMIKTYVPDASVESFTFNVEQIKFDFPLLCKLSKGKPIKEIRDLFSDPLKTIKEDLTNVQKKERLQFCAIALCTLFNNKFKKQWLNITSEQEDICIQDAIMDMCLEFDLDLTNDTDLTLIQDEFKKEQMDWLSSSGEIHHHIHEEIFKIASVICGESYERCFINHAPSSFIAKRYSFCAPIDGLITFNKTKYQKLYFDRLFRDLEHGSSYSMFQNIQLTEANYRTLFIDYCRKRALKFKELLGDIKSDNTDKKQLLRQDTIDFDLKVPLIDCASQGYKHMVDLLLEMNCDVNVIDNYGRSALYVASEQGHLEIVKKLVENEPHGANITFTDNNKKTSLHMACEEGHTDIVKYLIEKGADISALDLNGCSSLHMACISGKKEIVEHLLTIDKEEIYKSDNLGQTPIIIASLHGEKKVVEFLLLFEKEDLNLLKRVHDTDKKGFTPLLAACMNGHINTTTLLIDKGSDILHSDNNGRTALFIACEKGQKNIVELLIEKGKNMEKDIIDKLDWHMNAPIHIACAEKRTEIVKILIDNGAKINNCNEDKKTPLYVACEKGNATIVELLLQKQADINICDRHKKLPLHVACKRGDLKIVELLYARHKASSSNFDQLREASISIAKNQGHNGIVIFLTEHDIDTNNIKVQGNVISE